MPPAPPLIAPRGPTHRSHRPATTRPRAAPARSPGAWRPLPVAGLGEPASDLAAIHPVATCAAGSSRARSSPDASRQADRASHPDTARHTHRGVRSLASPHVAMEASVSADRPQPPSLLRRAHPAPPVLDVCRLLACSPRRRLTSPLICTARRPLLLMKGLRKRARQRTPRPVSLMPASRRSACSPPVRIRRRWRAHSPRARTPCHSPDCRVSR
jgi:hypothetical protein